MLKSPEINISHGEETMSVNNEENSSRKVVIEEDGG